jgi:hypothetical protein
MILHNIDNYIDNKEINKVEIGILIHNHSLTKTNTKFITGFATEKKMFNTTDLNNLIQNIFFTYRPLTQNKFEREEIANRFAHYPNLKIEYANPATFGLNKFEEINYESTLIEYLEKEKKN